LQAAGVASVAGALRPAFAATPDNGLRLWYKHPAPDWNEALPIGNGRMAAMIFGGVPVEHLALNEDTLCSEEPGTSDVDLDVTKLFDQVTGLLRNRQYAEAGDLITRHWTGRAWPCYQPLGDLELHFEGHSGSPEEYVRELDLTGAQSRVTYRENGVTYHREYFASHPDGVIVARITASQPGALNFRATLGSVHPTAHISAQGRDQIEMIGQAPGFVLRRTFEWVENRGEQWKYPELWDKDGKRRPNANVVLYGKDIGGRGTFFAARLKAIAKDGQIEARADGLAIRNASEVTLLLTMATSFNGPSKSPSKEGVDPAKLAAAAMERASAKNFEALQSTHLQDYRKLFDRVSLNVGAPTEQSQLPTDERIVKFANDQDPALAALYFQYGRYLTISGSREGSQPLNLQGMWNPLVIPPWACGYTTNINLEMNYWPVEVTNLSECFAPLQQMLKGLSVSGSHTAATMYHRRGWVLHHNTTLWRGTQPVDNDAMPAFWNVGAGWLCSHLWEHYQFTRDRAFLASDAYPMMKGAAEFLSDWLVDDGHGHLVTAAGVSPENRFVYTDASGQKQMAGVVMGPTMDLAIVRELFGNCIQASEILNCDAAFREELRGKLAKLLPYQVGKHGQLQEWPEDFEERELTHRHVSHLYALHPGNQITKDGTPKLYDAVKRTLEIRGDGGTGWSRAWKICFWARLGDGNHAYRIVRNLFEPAKSAPGKYNRGGVMPNLFCSCPPMQIDGNFGGTAGMAEMLLQSQQGEVHLLPALPDAWATGQVRGLVARGGFEVAMEWHGGHLSSATIHSRIGGRCSIRYGEKTASVQTAAGKSYRVTAALKVSEA
jgi:alpha-L-fucosidase 2